MNVPRDGKGRFRPQILPDPYKRVNKDYRSVPKFL
ncbi:hypothetical protein [Sulfurihydrogenibium sp.]|nr:hypothetical protein [Sulfurihydrogenibium sp.]